MQEIMIMCSDIVRDKALQVRQFMDAEEVQRLEDVLRSGLEFKDRIVIDGKNRLVCGFHRHEAYMVVNGKDSYIAANKVDFGSEIEAYNYAATDNMTHGKPLSSADKRMIYDRLSAEKSVSPDWLSKFLALPLEQISSWNAQKVVSARARAEGRDQGLAVREVDNHREVKTGPGTIFHAKRILERIFDMSIESDAATTAKLRELYTALRSYLKIA